MKFYKCISKSKALLLWAAVLLSLAALFVFSEECKSGGLNGILLCLGVLVPSLFPFMVLSGFLAQSNLSLWLAPLLNPVSKLLTGMPGITFIPVLMSVLGGYPVGARSTAEFLKLGLIDKEEAQKLSCICCCAGPGFLVTFAGVSILQSKEAGIILLCSQIISMLVLCLISRLAPLKNRWEKPAKNTEYKEIPVAEALVSSVNSAVKSSAGMCGFVIIFAAVCNILTQGLNISGSLGKLIICLLEITSGISLSEGCLSIELMAAMVGFGGICVHMQIFRELKGVEFSKLRFYVFRLIQGAVSMLSARILLCFFPITEEVFSSTYTTPTLTFYSTVAGCCALLVTSGLFIVSVRKKQIF